jgi:hypothetical protein
MFVNILGVVVCERDAAGGIFNVDGNYTDPNVQQFAKDVKDAIANKDPAHKCATLGYDGLEEYDAVFSHFEKMPFNGTVEHEVVCYFGD